MIKLSPDQWREIALKLNDAGPRRSEIVAAFAAELGCTEQTVYRRAKQHGYSSGRKTRADKGSSDLPKSVLIEIAEIISNSQRKNGKFTMTTRGAIEILARNGRLDPDRVSVPNVNLLLRQLGLNKKRLAAPPPITPLRSRHPNDVHQVDASVCIQFYIKGEKLRRRKDAYAKYYKNKYENFKKLANVLWRWVLTDHCSGVIWVRYYYSPGENAADAIDFLYRCWTPKTDPGHAPFCGVPTHLMTDKGSAWKAGATQDLMENFGITWLTGGKEKNPRARGQVENAHNIVETRFEANLYEESADSLEQLNYWADQWCREFNATHIHSRLKTARFPVWANNVRPHLKLPPEDIETFKMCALSKPETRDVTASRFIPFKKNGIGGTYWIDHPEYLYGDKLEVRYSPFDFPAIIVKNLTNTNLPELKLRPAASDNYGFSAEAPFIGPKTADGKHAHHTVTQRNKKMFAEARERLNEDGGLEAHNYQVPDTIQFQPHLRAEQINVETVVPEYSISHAKRVIMEKLGIDILTGRDIEIIENAWTGKTTVTANEIETVYQKLTTEEEAEGLRLEA